MWIWLCCNDTVCLEYDYTAITQYVENMIMFQWHHILWIWMCFNDTIFWEYDYVVIKPYVENIIIL